MPSDLKPEDDLPTPVNGETKTTSLTQLAWKAPKHPQIQPYEWWSLLGIVLLTIPLRLYSLSHPAEVVFDEVHIGKYISQYIKRQYFVDVHPPLARLLIYLTSILGGYDGNFEFEKITQPYTKSVPYILMRSLPAIYGIALVPIAYLTLRAFGCRSPSALLASLAVAFENGLIVQSRLFMLDSCMLYFIALALMSWTYFSAKDTKAAFSTSWWAFLGLTGISLGAAVSCKLVGILTIAVIGLSTIKQLVELPVSRTLWLQHFAARALCLIVVPAMIYLAAFAVHLQILNNPGEGDKYMSPAFQATLDGRRVPETFSDVAFGSEITLRHLETSNRYLQSHRYIYPTGGDQQQVFLANKTDHSVLWKIQHADATDHDYHHEDVMLITSGTQVRFRHLATDAYLASEDVRPPMSRLMTQNEVSGSNRETDENSNWIVEIKNGEDRLSKSRVRAIETTFRLKHARSGCYLFSHDVKLPQWAFFNQEVTCNKEGANLTGSMWYVETNGHPQCESHSLNEWPRLRALALADTEKVEKSAYSNPGFFWKVVELHEVMWDRNAEMTAPHKYASRPGAWPLLREGVVS
ncbi:hypothetical protein FRB98_005508 [Tulasnella sp. 332]|nr:hypothetical protein FRB98_005508 [Tulasnella sp. 332]